MSKPTIAVVDDDTQFLRMMQMILDAEGYNAQVLVGGTNAFGGICRLLPDLIVLDVRMHHSDNGLTLLERLTRERVTSHIPIIACSAAHGDLLEKQEYLAELGVQVLHKPFKVEALHDVIDDLLNCQTRNAVAQEYGRLSSPEDRLRSK